MASSAGFPAERIVLRGNAKTPAGLLGSQITRPEAFETGATRLVGLMADIHAEHGVTLPELNLGGGHGVPYADDQDFDLTGFAPRIRAVVGGACAARRLPVPLRSPPPPRLSPRKPQPNRRARRHPPFPPRLEALAVPAAPAGPAAWTPRRALRPCASLTQARVADGGAAAGHAVARYP